MKVTNAQDLFIDKLLRNSESLIVPDYQRRYSWRQSQWADFWQDLIDLEENQTHFLGSILVITRPYTTADYNVQEIVDGQQRFATISILLSIFRNYFNKNGKPDLAGEINNNYLYSKKPGRDRIQKLKLGDLDAESYNKILKNDIDKISSKKISNAYYYFQDKIYKHKEPEILFYKLIDQMIVVLIETHSDKDAFRLFETLNDRGLALTPVDLIKNYLLKVASEKDEETMRNIKGLWSEMLRNLDGFDTVSFFRRHLMSTTNPKTVGKIADTELYDRIKHIINDGNDLNEFVKDIRDQSELYKKLSNAKIDMYTSQRNTEINEHLLNIIAIRATTSYTLLLRAFRDVEDPKGLLNILRMIEIFALRRIICRWTTADLDNIYNHLALNAFEKQEPMEYIKQYFTKSMPKDAEFEASFKDSSRFRNNNQTKYILSTIEEKHFGHGGKKVDNRYKVHIEHIMPAGVFRYKKYRTWKNKIKDQKTYDLYKTRIGNLTLLERRPNIKASNKPFEEKKKHYHPDQTDMVMTRKLLDYNDWTKDEINDRSQKLAKIAISIWNF